MLNWLTRTPASSRREILCEDGIAYLATYTGGPTAIVSVPPADLDEGRFAQALGLLLMVGNPAVLALPDLARCEMALHVARHIVGSGLIWNRVAQTEADCTFLVAFGRGLAPVTDRLTVMPAGRSIAPGVIGLAAARAMVQCALGSSDSVTDPFCGAGVIPAVAQALGAKVAIGVCGDEASAERARRLKLARK